MTDTLNKYSDQLKSIAINVTPDDKKTVMNALRISRPTLDKYLQGKAAKVDTANLMLKFLTRRISAREKELLDSTLS